MQYKLPKNVSIWYPMLNQCSKWIKNSQITKSLLESILTTKTIKLGVDNNYDHAILRYWSIDNDWTKFLYA